jgi:O-antigen/teichoic acid export membrane protein
MAIYLRVDAVLIEKLHAGKSTSAGVYAGAYRITDALNTVGYIWAGLLLPMFARLHIQDTDELKRLCDLAPNHLCICFMERPLPKKTIFFPA